MGYEGSGLCSCWVCTYHVRMGSIQQKCLKNMGVHELPHMQLMASEHKHC